MSKFFVLLCALVLLNSCGQAAPPPATLTPSASPTQAPPAATTLPTATVPADSSTVFHVTPTEGVVVEYQVKGDTAYIDVQSSTGIGGARVDQIAGKQPSNIVLRLYLKGLESLKFSHPTYQVQVAVSSGGAHNVREIVTMDSTASETEITQDSEFWMPVEIVADAQEIPLTDGYFQVELPRAYFEQGAGEFALEWIDFFR